ncbi:MAG TPA: helix-hairpin-helix domain-containing protein [Candidatus Binatia bacterium]|jgi:DNA uptake protein ComE-like DNA-binding protein
MKKSVFSIVGALFFSGVMGVPLAWSADMPSIPGANEIYDKATGHSGSKTDDRNGDKKHLVDINSASAKDLGELKGVDEDVAKKIVKNRPYARKDELVSKKIIKQKDYDKIKDQIVASHGTGTLSEAAESGKKKK